MHIYSHVAVATAFIGRSIVVDAIDTAIDDTTTRFGISRRLESEAALFRRDDPKEDNGDFDYDEESICYSYGIDFQNGGSYFIDSRSNASFTCVSQFESCVENTYSNIILVNEETGDQLLCSNVPTTPDLVSQMSTCPITKEEMSSGDWSIIAIGNNGDGSPFGWQRDFYLTVGIPQTTTVTSTLTFSQTTTPVTTVVATSTVQTTTNVPNKSTVTIAAYTKTLTITPKPIMTTTSKIITRTFDRWTKTVSTVTKTVFATCTVPTKPSNADPECTIKPTVVPLPSGLSINASRKTKRADKALNAEQIRKRFEQLKATRDRIASNGNEERGLNRRSPDAPIITEMDPIPASTTTTFTAATSTVTDISLVTQTATITDPPTTVKKGTQTVTTTLAPKTKTITRIGYTITYKTKTMAKTWTYTTTATPAASVTACSRKGGHFGEVW